MKRFFFAGFVAGALLLFFGWWGFFELVLGFGLTGDGGFDISPQQTYSSPDGAYGAHVYIHSGGGAAGWSDKLVCLGSGADYEYSDDYNIFFISDAQAELDIKWLDTKNLSITYEVSALTTTIRNQPNRFDAVTVHFNPIQKP